MIAGAAHHDSASGLRQVDEGCVQLGDERVVDGIALGRTLQADVQHGTLCLDVQQVQRLEDRRPGSDGR